MNNRFRPEFIALVKKMYTEGLAEFAMSGFNVLSPGLFLAAAAFYGHPNNAIPGLKKDMEAGVFL